jgi:hypothetical protein
VSCRRAGKNGRKKKRPRGAKLAEHLQKKNQVLTKKTLDTDFFETCFAKSRSSMPGKREQWRAGVYAQIAVK